MNKLKKVENIVKMGGLKLLSCKVRDILLHEENYHSFIINWTKSLKEAEYPTAMEKIYAAATGEKLDLSDPKSFNEKQQWLKLYEDTSFRTMLADKYAVKEWVANKVGSGYVIPLLGVWDSFDEIDFDALPDSFVLKVTHGSGMNIIVKDKSHFDRHEARNLCEKWLSSDYAFKYGFELQYRDIPRKIIAEEYICNKDGSDVVDYKIMCFHGEPKLIQVHQGRFSGQHTQDIYTADWVKTDIQQTGEPMSDGLAPRPEKLDEMLSVAKALSEGIIFVRVDLYLVGDKIYFGEMTFQDAGGYDLFTRWEDDLMLGSWIHLPIEKEGIVKK